MDTTEAKRLIANANTAAEKEHLYELVTKGAHADDRMATIRARGKKELMAGLMAEVTGAAAGGAAVGVLKAKGHEELLVPVAAAGVIAGAWLRIKQPHKATGEIVFSAGAGMAAALIAVETEAYINKQAKGLT